MRRTILKIAAIGTVGFVITYAMLAMVTHFLILPSLTVSGLLTLSAIASYVPPNGIPISLSLPLILGAFFVSALSVSSAFSVIPQRGGSVIIPLVATFTVFLGLTIFGFRPPTTPERRQ